MIYLIKSILLTGFICSVFVPGPVSDVRHNCGDIGIAITLPSGFVSLDSSKMNELSKRGEKAVKESFDKETLKGWQEGCLNLQDSMKRLINVVMITEKEAIAIDGSADKFIAHTFKDYNDFIVKRLETRANIKVDTTGAISQTDISIAGQKVKKNSVTLSAGPLRLFFARQYFFRKDGTLFMLAFTGSPKAKDNENIVKAIEGAKKM